MTHTKSAADAQNIYAVDNPDDASTAFFKAPDVSSLSIEVYDFWRQHPPTLRYECIERLLPGYPDAEFILHIVRHGINIRDPRFPVPAFDCANSRSCKEFEGALAKITADNIASSRYFVPRTLHSSHIHSVAINYKPERDKYRDIHNLSLPQNASVNSCTRFVSYRWVRMDDIMQRIQPNSWGCRFDVKDYYRHFSVNPEDWHLLACILAPALGEAPCELWDTRMPFGFRPAVEIAHRMTTAIVYAINQTGISNVFAILDDFFDLHEGPNPPAEEFNAICKVFEDFGFPLNMKPHKTHSWQQNIGWCGWDWDLITPSVAMGEWQRNTLQTELRALVGKPKATAEHIMHIEGRLSWASTVVWGGRTFTQPWQNAAARAQHMKPFHHIRISAEMQQSISWWLEFAQKFNGRRLILGNKTPRIRVATDATGDGSIGIFVDKHHYLSLTGDQVRNRYSDAPPATSPIFIHESFALRIACEYFGNALANKHIDFTTDNPATSKMTRFLAHRIPELHNIAVKIFHMAEKYNFRFRDIALVPGIQNQLADALSRQQFTRFFNLLSSLAP